MITGRRFSRLHPKAASAVFCKDGFGDGYHLVIRVDLGWAKTLCRKGFRLFGGHSHSMVATGLGLMSYSTRHTPGTSLRIRPVMVCSTLQGSSGTVAVMASTVLTARIVTGQSSTRRPFFTPVERKSGITVKNCHTCRVSPALSNSSRKMASASRPRYGAPLPGRSPECRDRWCPAPGKQCPPACGLLLQIRE